MVVVRAATMEDWQVLRDIRLAALRDAPNASVDLRRAGRIGRGGLARRILAGALLRRCRDVNETKPAGLVGSQERPARWNSSRCGSAASAWPGRRAGAGGRGDQLGQGQERRIVHLWLTEANQRALALYERCGFSLERERQPLPSKPNLTEIGMIRPL